MTNNENPESNYLYLPAFPTEVSFDGRRPQEAYQVTNTAAKFPGVSRLEWFTAMAMQGLCAEKYLSAERIPETALKIAKETLQLLELETCPPPSNE